MESIIPGNDIGFLINKSKQEEMTHLLTKHMNSSIWNKDSGISIFSIEDIDVENGMVLTPKKLPGFREVKTAKIPSIVYNTSIQYGKENIRKLRNLLENPNLNFLNKVNRYDQGMIFDILETDSAASYFLSTHYPFDLNTLKYVLDEWGQVFLLPVRSPHLKKMIIISKCNISGSRHCMISLGEKVWRCKKEQLVNRVLEIIKGKKHFIVKGITPLKWQGIKIEARIYVQKIKTNEWGVTHMIGKNDYMGYEYYFMNKAHELTVILQEIFPKTYLYIIDKFKKHSIRVCSYLEKYLPDISNCYLDFLMDEMGNPCLVYFGGWEQQEWLVKINEPSILIQYWNNALNYLMDLREKKVREGNI